MLRILHLSDMHFRASVSFDQDQVQKTLLSYIENTPDAFDALAVTGDIAFSGQAAEYDLAEDFLRKLMAAMAIASERVAICPGNHDIDRSKISDLARTLPDTPQSDRYFTNGLNCLHIQQGQQAFIEFYERLLGRKYSMLDSINGPLTVESGGVALELWEMNTSIFARGDDDHGQLWVGRASLSRIEPLEGSSTEPFRVLLGHHPFEWLASEEESKIRALAEQRFGAFLRGHLHQGGYAATSSGVGELIQIAAGALYQGAARPIEANILEVCSNELAVRPIRYVDEPLPAWVPDNGKLGPSAATRVAFRTRANALVSVDAVQPVSLTQDQFSYPQLFSNSEGAAIFVEPRLCDKPFGAITPELCSIKELDIGPLLADYDRLQIEVATEHGATTLAHYICHKFAVEHATKAVVLAADKIPNYKIKLDKFLQDSVANDVTAIVIDDVLSSTHKRMIEVVSATGRFKKIVAICPSSEFSSVRDMRDSKPLFEGAPPIYAWPLDRSRLRKLALQVFVPQNEEDVAFAVEKTYIDLVSLAIPLTPTNVIMYLHILKNERDFVPLDRVSIIQRYVNEALWRSSDQLTSEFGVRDRISLLSAFVFDLFMVGKTRFSGQDWRSFSRQFQERTYADFDADLVLRDMLRSRLIIEFGSQYYIRYAFVYDFLVGSHAASSPDKLSAFLTEGHHRRLPRVVEVMAAVALDPEPLLETLQADLDRHLSEFQAKYVSEPYDPVSLAEWKTEDDSHEQQFWGVIQSQMEEGSAPSAAIDKVKESLFAESRSSDQEVIIQDFSALEIDLFRSAHALQSALRVAVSLEGRHKLAAVRSILRTELIVLQIATAFSKKLALSRAFRWGGLLFLNQGFDASKTPDDYGDIVPEVVFGIDVGIADAVCEKMGTKRLGSTFKGVVDHSSDLSEFELFHMFALILRTKPRNWENELSKIIENISYRKWRQRSFVDLLMSDYKNEPNTISSKEKIRHLVALVETKRTLNKKSPGSKAVSKMQEHLEKEGRFNGEVEE